ncbi:MAG TPA: site-2 protease family protein [Syntrophales bacterium]|nr:site-2 protease family protein [Syntrophales bacterium]
MKLKSTIRRFLSSPGFNHPSVPIVLFAITVLTTLAAGALQAGVDIFDDPLAIRKGIPFSFTLLLILGCHELGHWVASRRHGVNVSYPYFIPGPTLVGTFGAFIAMKSPISDRNALIDIGAAGPLAGLAVTIPVLFIGLSLSQVVPAVQTEGVGIHLGECALFSTVNWIVNGTIAPDQDVILHPVAFAGWIGLLVTSLNLIPVGQLDGGHIIYAIFGPRQREVAWMVVGLLLVLGFLGWEGWLIWGGILLILGVRHPPVIYDWGELDNRRLAIGYLAMFCFALTFMPIPFTSINV